LQDHADSVIKEKLILQKLQKKLDKYSENLLELFSLRKNEIISLRKTISLLKIERKEILSRHLTLLWLSSTRKRGLLIRWIAIFMRLILFSKGF